MLTEEQLAEYEAKFPGCVRVLVNGPAGEREVIIRPATRPEWKRFKARQRDPQWQPESTEELITACVVYPDARGFQALLDTPGYAAVADAISQIREINELLGLSVKASAK